MKYWKDKKKRKRRRIRSIKGIGLRRNRKGRRSSGRRG
jgi:hypothetical protein